VFPVPVPVRRGTLRRETASSVTILGGALVLLQGFVLPLGSSVSSIAILLGAAIVALGALASSLSRHRPLMGAVIALLGASSLISGGGFYAGAFFAILGGALVVATGPHRPQDRRSATWVADSLGPPCPNCGHHIPTWTSKCPYCGFP
jgi:hypothetical protein